MKKEIFVWLLLPISLCCFSKNSISIDEMKQHYCAFCKNEITSYTEDADEIVMSEYGFGSGYRNPRNASKGIYHYYKAKGLRTEQYPDKKHYWSLVRYYKKPYNNTGKGKRHKSKRLNDFVKYLTLDSIQNITKTSWSADFKNSYSYKKKGMFYARSYSADIFMQSSEDVNILGFNVTPYFREFTVKNGIVKGFTSAFEKCYNQEGQLWQKSSITLDGTLMNHIHVAMSMFASDINKMGNVQEHISGKRTYDLLIVMNSDGTANVDCLSDFSDKDTLLNHLSAEIKKLPNHYFTPLWTIDRIALPGLYVEGIYENDQWRFSMDKFIIQ